MFFLCTKLIARMLRIFSFHIGKPLKSRPLRSWAAFADRIWGLAKASCGVRCPLGSINFLLSPAQPLIYYLQQLVPIITTRQLQTYTHTHTDTHTHDVHVHRGRDFRILRCTLRQYTSIVYVYSSRTMFWGRCVFASVHLYVCTHSVLYNPRGRHGDHLRADRGIYITYIYVNVEFRNAVSARNVVEDGHRMIAKWWRPYRMARSRWYLWVGFVLQPNIIGISQL